MAFGLNVKVEALKVNVPKVDVAAEVKNLTGAVSGAVDSAKGAVNGAVDSAKSAVAGAVVSTVSAATDAVESAKASLATFAGAIADVAVSFTGSIEDFVLEPHLQLDANASFGKTKFEKGPINIRIEISPDEAKKSSEMVHLFSASGEYDEKKKISEFSNNNSKTIVLKFEDAPMQDTETYSLEIIPESGQPIQIFSSVPYSNLFKSRGEYLNS